MTSKTGFSAVSLMGEGEHKIGQKAGQK